MSIEIKAPPEAFTRKHAIEDDMPGLPETVPHLETTEYQERLAWRKNEGALDRERETIKALDAAGVPQLVEISRGVRSSFPADRVRWLAKQVVAPRPAGT
jgi:hypothetical protein